MYILPSNKLTFKSIISLCNVRCDAWQKKPYLLHIYDIIYSSYM